MASRLRSLGYLVIDTREPGGSAISEQIRTVLLDVGNRGMNARCELLLYLASRAQHLADIIRPSLEKGAVVLCDRYADATLAYQGFGRGLGGPVIHQLNRFASGGLIPDLTILLDIPVALGLERKRQEGAMDRLDLERDLFHETVRKGYLRIARQNPRRVRLIDGSAAVDQVTVMVQRLVEQRLRLTKNHLTKVESRGV